MASLVSLALQGGEEMAERDHLDGWARYEEVAGRAPDSWTEAELKLVALAELRAEMNNGGFDQYFFNSAGDRAQLAVSVAQSLQLLELAELVQRAMSLFGREYPRGRELRQERLEQVSPEGDAFDELDDEYYDLEAASDLDAAMDALVADI